MDRLLTSARLACAAETERQVAAAQLLAQTLELPCLGVQDPLLCSDWDLLLWSSERGLMLQATGRKAMGPVWVDFASGASAHRQRFGGGKGQMIAKACGLNQGVLPRVADVTAGLGGDAYVLASLGCELLLAERHPLVYQLLADGLKRGLQQPLSAEVVARMQLVADEGLQWLSASPQPQPDVIYLDPMFPHTDTRAAVKKEMALFRQLVGGDDDADRLLEAALDVALARVVVKRPRKAPALGAREPGYCLEGRACRYDIYPLRSLKAVQ